MNWNVNRIFAIFSLTFYNDVTNWLSSCLVDLQSSKTFNTSDSCNMIDQRYRFNCSKARKLKNNNNRFRNYFFSVLFLVESDRIFLLMSMLYLVIDLNATVLSIAEVVFVENLIWFIDVSFRRERKKFSYLSLRKNCSSTIFMIAFFLICFCWAIKLLCTIVLLSWCYWGS
jgi:hypothetical protein